MVWAVMWCALELLGWFLWVNWKFEVASPLPTDYNLSGLGSIFSIFASYRWDIQPNTDLQEGSAMYSVTEARLLLWPSTLLMVVSATPSEYLFHLSAFCILTVLHWLDHWFTTRVCNETARPHWFRERCCDNILLPMPEVENKFASFWSASS